MNRMIRALSKGRVPKVTSAPTRQGMSTEIVNEEIDSLKLKKDEDEIVEHGNGHVIVQPCT